MSLIANLLTRFFGFVLFDAVRQMEIFSAFCLLAWAGVLMINPSVMGRDNYVAFHALGATVWIGIFAMAAAFQIIAMFSESLNMRFYAMACASGCWLTIALAFVSSSILTTATTNYTLMFVLTFISGSYLGWKSSAS